MDNQIKCVVLTEDGKVLYRKEDSNGTGSLYLMDEGAVSVIPDAKYAGISWDKKYIGIAYDYGIDVYSAEGDKIATYSLPDYWIEDEELNRISSITPFHEGEWVLVVSEGGVYVLAEDDVALIHGESEELGAMVYGCVSPDEAFIAVGNQDSEHIILEVETEFEVWDEVSPVSACANYAQFNKDGSHVLLSSCQEEEGHSIILGLDEGDITEVEQTFKVTAGASYDEGFILGTEEGQIVYVKPDGSTSQAYDVGAAVSGMDVSTDGKRLAVGTITGDLHLLDVEFESNKDLNFAEKGAGQFYFLQEDYAKRFAGANNKTTEYRREVCEKCGGVKIVYDKALKIEIEGRKKGNYYCARGHFFIDSKLEEVLVENKITGFYTKEIEGDNAENIKEMVIVGSGGFLRNKKGRMLKKCENCNKVAEKYDELIGIVVLEEDWDGTDIFLIENFKGVPVVTQKVKELFEANKIKNAIFVPIEEYEFG